MLSSSYILYLLPPYFLLQTFAVLRGTSLTIHTPFSQYCSNISRHLVRIKYSTNPFLAISISVFLLSS
jgi:hypothetical protein